MRRHGDDRAERRRAEDAGQLKRAAVERDGAAKLAARNEARHERRARRPEKCPRRAKDGQANVSPKHRRGEIGKQSEGEAHHRQNECRDQDDFFPIENIGDMSGGNRAKNHRNHQRQADERQRQRRMRAPIKFPVNCHDEHLLAERRDQSSDEVARVIRVSQNGVGTFVHWFWRGLVRQIFWRFLIVHETAAHKLAEKFRWSRFHLNRNRQ